MESEEINFEAGSLHHALVDAVLRGDQDVVLHLVQLGNASDIDSVDERGLTALHWSAASAEGEELVPLLLSLGYSPDKRDIHGHTPLHLHCLRGRVFGALSLLHQGCDANAREKNTLRTPLHLAGEFGHGEVCLVLYPD